MHARCRKLLLAAAAQIAVLIGYRYVVSEPREPAAVLVLGGDAERDVAGVELVKGTRLHLYISSPQEDAVQRVGALPSGQVTISWEALDTVTNFTTMIPILREHNVQSVYLVTSQYHMRRAKACAWVMLGWYGISYTPYATPPSGPQHGESLMRVIRDTMRAVVWCLTGIDGSSVTAWVHPGRLRVSRRMMDKHEML
eukprot:TRINITY_DN16522_c0_g1_i1.p1 TRINITY_DN16522_c0_g1~~TRINITY_DN16522_c0_g1_i1.p1  ORF type:complete len:197 (+),score=26.39 TRINITY_DN16522_c0_g1_i1:36-626(+)